MSGTLYLVATPIGNLEDITHRAVRILREVAVIAAEDTRAARVLLGHYGIGLGGERRLVSLFEGNEAARAEELVGALTAGRSVALISEAGTPAISDPGERLVRAAIDAGVRVEPVPGPVAGIAALIASGLPTAGFRFLGFLPREDGRRREILGGLRGERATMIVYEAPDRVAATVEDMIAAFGPARQVSLARELTKLHEEHRRGTLSELAAALRERAARGECVLVVAGAQQAPDVLDIEGEMRALLAQGLGPRDAAARLVVVTGKPRRQLYQLALALQRDADGGGRRGA